MPPRSEIDPIRCAVAEELSRRDLLDRSARLGLAAMITSALSTVGPLAFSEPALAAVSQTDATLQAFFDTIIPGRRVSLTEAGNPIDPQAIAGVDREPGAVEADSLLIAHNAKIGFDTLAPPFLADLAAKAAPQGGPFLLLDYDHREAACLAGLDFNNPDRLLWEAAAAIPFTAFCAAANVVNATRANSVGLRVMGHPGAAPNGYRNYSYRRRLAQERTRTGSLR